MCRVLFFPYNIPAAVETTSIATQFNQFPVSQVHFVNKLNPSITEVLYSAPCLPRCFQLNSFYFHSLHESIVTFSHRLAFNAKAQPFTLSNHIKLWLCKNLLRQLLYFQYICELQVIAMVSIISGGANKEITVKLVKYTMYSVLLYKSSILKIRIQNC